MKNFYQKYCAVLCALLLVACSAQTTVDQTQTTAQSAAVDGVVESLTLAGGTDWGAPNPYLHSARGPGNAKKDLVFASLLEADENGIIAWMAQDWQVNEDSITFYLNEAAMFHDGTPLTTADVAFTIGYTKEHPPVFNTLGAGDSFLISSYEIVDDYTITVYVDVMTADTLSNVGGFEILPKHIWENVEDPTTFTDAEAFIGSGAYRLEAYDAASGTYAFSAFEEFCAGTPAAQVVQFVPVSDEVLAFENGEIDIVDVPADLYDTYAAQENLAMLEKANDMGYKMLINFEECPEFLDLTMRQALYAALDREAVVSKVFRGMGAVGSAGYVPEGSIYYNEDVEEYSYDPDSAKAVFEGQDIAVTLLVSNSDTDLKIAELMKADLEAAGLTITVQNVDSAAHTDAINAGTYEFALVGNGGWGGCVPTYLNTIFSDTEKNSGGSPHTMGPIGWSSASITALCDAQAVEVDFDTRVALFKELQQEISEEVPLVVVATQSSYVMYDETYYDGWMKTYDYQQVEQNRLSYVIR